MNDTSIYLVRALHNSGLIMRGKIQIELDERLECVNGARDSMPRWISSRG